MVDCWRWHTSCRRQNLPSGRDRREWFAVRSTFRLEDDEGRAVFERKVVLYLEVNAEVAISRAENDSDEYLRLNKKFEQLPGYEIYSLGHGSSNLNGEEVWSFVAIDEPD